MKKERAIAENELQNKIELSRLEKSLIEQRGQNERRRASEEAEAKRIEALANVERVRLNADAQADSISAIEAARNQAEQEKMNIYRHLPPSVILGLAAQQLAANLHAIEHLNLSPDALGSMLTTLLSAGTRKLEEDS